MSFFSRLYLNIVFTVIFCVTLTSIAIDVYLEQQEINEFAWEAHLIHNYVNDHFDQLEYQANSKTKLQLPYPFSQHFSAKVYPQSTPDDEICLACEAITEINGFTFYELMAGERLVTLPLKQHQAKLVFYEILDHEREMLEEALLEEPLDEGAIVFFSLIISLIVFLGITLYWPIKHLQSQIAKLNDAHRAFGSGNLTARADNNTQKPMDELANSFNDMASAIAHHVHEKSIFAQAIPHEVRTPLSRIQLASGLIRKKTSDLDALTLLDDVDNYVTDIDQLISQIVEFSKLNDHGTGATEQQQVQLEEFIASRVKLLGKDTSTPIHFSQDANNKPTQLLVNPMYLRLVLDNFINNALNHCQQQVWVRVSNDEGQINIAVQDDGKGIPEDQQDTIFMPFSRLDKSRNRATGGLGLGLPIAKAAAKKMQGQITVANAREGGAIFTLKLTP